MREEIDAGAEFVRAFDQYAPVAVAFWLKASDDYRYLYIASERIDDTNFDLAYREVVRLANAMPSPHLDTFRVKVINANDPLAKAAAEVNRRFPGRSDTRLGGTWFGDQVVDDVYIYASPSLAATP